MQQTVLLSNLEPKEQNKDMKEQAITKQHKMKAKTKTKAYTPVSP